LERSRTSTPIKGDEGKMGEAEREVVLKPKGNSTMLDRLGDTGLYAADFAAKHGAENVPGVDEETRQQVRDAISLGIREMRGAPATARAIRKIVPGLSTPDAQVLASTEMSNAMSEAQLQKLRGDGRTHKQLIGSSDSCPDCKADAEQGAIPLEQPFKSGHMRTPIHDGCRCAISGARPPESVHDAAQRFSV
jgi:hypothetical protein